jgi:hypothetical protein
VTWRSSMLAITALKSKAVKANFCANVSELGVDLLLQVKVRNCDLE